MRFAHDCRRCVPLGETDYAGFRPGVMMHFDLYYCEQDIGGPTIIARYGDDGPEYTSGMVFGKLAYDENPATREPLGVAYGIVLARGLPTGYERR